ncbi:MAG: CAMP factor family pore-forming toxin [Ezakiella sp.]|nr:CAMP factor family pore-forming toxin [Ezakiella sp.]MDD7471730.1 CAMP factor family pore-forming toxin [Bacillota bacterium]MDY3922940.1 CAMP factor family pore-forming toxin [Ezakiella sp.]
MKSKKKVISFVLTVLMVLSAVVPFAGVVKADENKDAFLLEISGLRQDINNAVSSVADIEPADEEEKDMLDKYHEAAKDLNRELQISEERVNSAVGGVMDGGSIYDLTTIPVRIQLLIRIGRAIRFATTELSNKVVAAHTKITEYILTGILYCVNPFASEGQIMEYIDRFEPLQEELLNYPDLSPNDIATIYKKGALSRELREGRRVLNTIPSMMRKFRGQKLQQIIQQGTALWWRLDVTCGEIDALVEKLHEAMEEITGPSIRVERIEFMEGEGGYIAVDKRTKLRPMIFPNEVKNKDVIIYSSNPYVARVSGTEIIPVKTGFVTLTAVAKDNGVKKTFDLYIVEPGGFVSNVPPMQPTSDNTNFDGGNNPGSNNPPIQDDRHEVTTVVFANEKFTLTEGETLDMSAMTLVYPLEAIDKTLTFGTDNEDVVTIDTVTGMLLANKPGIATVYATSNNHITAKTFVEVKAKPVQKEIQIVSIKESKRTAGIFKIDVEIVKGDRPFNGYATVTVESNGRVREKTVYVTGGKASVTFLGYIRKYKDFVATVKAGKVTAEYKFSFE